MLAVHALALRCTSVCRCHAALHCLLLLVGRQAAALTTAHRRRSPPPALSTCARAFLRWPLLLAHT